MLRIQSFVFSPFSENTYVLSDDSGECIVLDPGCYNSEERGRLTAYLEDNQLKLVKIVNTHCHLDHIFGNAFLKGKYDVPLIAHKKDLPLLEGAQLAAQLYGVSLTPSPLPDAFIDEGDVLTFGETKLEVLFVPGHAPGHVAFYHRESKQLFSGDVLFQMSIGRTDLPGGSMDVLMDSIFTKILPLEDEVKVYSGHGPVTTVGAERRSNPYILSHRV